MNRFLATAEEAVREGGAILKGMLGKVEASEKGPADLVTEADFASQEAVKRIVLGAFPDHGFIGEEGGRQAQIAGNGESCWIVDPLDGTTNFVHGVPHFCVSLALEREGRLFVGAVYNPMTEECYLAEVGKGARLNGEPIQTSKVVELSKSLAALGLPSVVKSQSPDLLLFNEALNACQAIRRTGSAALNLCYLAAGRFDVVWSYCTKVWDIAAGVLIIEEAGGTIESPDGGFFDVHRGQVFGAASAPLMEQLRDMATKAGLREQDRL